MATDLKDLAAIGLGDLRVVPKVRVLRTQDFGFDLAVIPTFTLPSNFPRESYLGDPSLTFAPTIALSRELYGVTMATNLGYRLRPDTQFLGMRVGQELFYRAAVRYDFTSLLQVPVQVSAAVDGSTYLFAPFENLYENPVEVLFGAGWDVWGPVQLFADAGFGVVPGYGAPDARLIVGARYAPRTTDLDMDGIHDDDDACPEAPEDLDGFEDVDGCPETDNDGDGILDVNDSCANEAEDQDGFRDGDGCPDTDNDNDTVLDVNDTCPNEPGTPERDGCPLRDTDGDGLNDDVDKCPTEQGPVELEGCPRRDGDGDGLADDVDHCPEEAGPVTAAGCPDKDGDGVGDKTDRCPDEPGLKAFQGCNDKDGDGIADLDDKCPDKPETINGVDDEDGCPDRGKSLVILRNDKVEILEKVFFDFDSATIQKRSFNLLTQVKSLLRAHPHATKVRVEGHTDATGDDDYNLKLSQSRAESVRAFLIKAGIDEARLEAKGFGETQPLGSNKTAKGRDKNRRVEFVIIEVNGEPTDKADPPAATEPAKAPATNDKAPATDDKAPATNDKAPATDDKAPAAKQP